MGAPPRPLNEQQPLNPGQVARLARQQQPGVAQGWQDNKRELHAQLDLARRAAQIQPGWLHASAATCAPPLVAPQQAAANFAGSIPMPSAFEPLQPASTFAPPRMPPQYGCQHGEGGAACAWGIPGVAPPAKKVPLRAAPTFATPLFPGVRVRAARPLLERHIHSHIRTTHAV